MDWLDNRSHKRLNILTGEWILVSPHRDQRPWQGQEDDPESNSPVSFDPDCYLCPGNSRAAGATNPRYAQTFVFDNDFAALKGHSESAELENGLLRASSESGICRVICFSPDHSLSLAQMELSDIEAVIGVWQHEYSSLGGHDHINHVQIFENKGAIMGCSNPHPHGQIWAQQSIPNESAKKGVQQAKHFATHKSSMLMDYLKQEKKLQERIIHINDGFTVLVPFWATWPFETMIIPNRHTSHIGEMTDPESGDFAKAIKELTSSFDRLFDCSFPYSAGIHQCPTDGSEHEHWHWHMSFYPPLLRSASIKKFMVGYEMLAMPQRDITPEKAASILRSKILENDR